MFGGQRCKHRRRVVATTAVAFLTLVIAAGSALPASADSVADPQTTTTTATPDPSPTTTPPPTTPPTVPDPSTTTSSSTSTTTASPDSTTTTTTSPPTSTSTAPSPSTSTAPPAHPKRRAAPTPATILAQLRPTGAAVPETGPPDVAPELQLPSDSLTAAMAELDALQQIARRLTDAYPRLVVSAESTRLAAVEAARTLELTRAGYDRARGRVARSMLDGARTTRPTGISGSDLADLRDRKLVRATMLALRRQVIRHVEAGVAADRARDDAEALRRNDATAAATVAGEISGVTAKLTSAATGLALAGPVTAADPGPTEIARLAHAAELALVTNVDVAGSRHRLADAVGAQTQVDPARFDAEWAATPLLALRPTFFALSQVGKPYVYATDGPATYDCSGLTRRAWQQIGIALAHFSGAQLHSGLPVDPARIRPGDLLAYGPDGSDHVVLSIGAGFDVEARGRQWGVVIERADTDATGGRFAGAARPLP